MITLHFIRHGQSLWNAEIRIQGSSDPDLSDLGISQAQALVGKLPDFERVYSSDLARAQQTTSNILEGDIAHVDFRASLREIHLGPWEGVLLQDATDQFPKETDQFRNQPEAFQLDGAESFHQLQKRSRNAIDEILTECEGEGVDGDVLVVSHGAFLKSLLIDYAGWSLNEIWHEPHMDNCGHSVVQYSDRMPKMVKFADALEW